MSPNRSNDPVSQLGNGHSLDASLSRAIDAMSLLREDLRREGIRDLADDFDAILVKCLTLYVDRENTKLGPDMPDDPNGSGAKAD